MPSVVVYDTVKMVEETSGQKPVHPLFQQKSTQQFKPQTRIEIQLPASPSSTTSTNRTHNHNAIVSGEHVARDSTITTPQPISPASLVPETSPGSINLLDSNADFRNRGRTNSPTNDMTDPYPGTKVVEEPRRSARASGKDKVYTFAPDIGLSTRRHEDFMRVNLSKPEFEHQASMNVGNGRNGDADTQNQRITSAALNTSDEAVLASTTTNGQVRDRQKKLLLFNPKTGTIGSPPANKTAKERHNRTKQKTRQLVMIKYGESQALPKEIGTKIDDILSSPPQPNTSPTPKKRRSKQNVKNTPNKKSPPPIKLAKSPPKAGKALHPLFGGKPKPVEKSQPVQKLPANTNIVSLTTPKRPVLLTSKDRVAAPFAGFGAPTKIVKTGGALHPAWPWKGCVHVRGATLTQQGMIEDHLEHDYSKAKFTSTVVSTDEDVLHCVSKDLDIQQILRAVNELDMDVWPAPPQWLHLPIKHIKSGRWLQHQLRQELRYSSPNNVLVDSHKLDGKKHPALDRVFNAIATTLSAFDLGESETQTWAQKYSPKTAADVLQTGQEAFILRDWLQNHVVTSVEAGSRAKSDQHSLNTKRKRKSKRSDDFIVADGESDDEISENEDDFGVNRTSIACETVIRPASKSAKIKNAVLISGPTGSGKSAMVYAIAKELGFEVFEISPGSRRSGKDILERVGDMTRNHLVNGQHNTTISTATPSEDSNEDDKIDQALADDISSGRQGTMGSFFAVREKPKLNYKTLTVKKVEPPKTHHVSTLRDTPLFKPIKKDQKQSLILLEEVDILYEEDKNFWMTVLGLIISSRRPLIMTCNDESAIQADLDEHLHAILRLTTPPVHLAADYLLLVAAAEGHLLERASVKRLYENRSHDLRASLDELNFWCQFGIGDQKHGGDWYYRRRSGQDLDVDGHPLRVVSQGTYTSGLEWLSADVLASNLRDLVKDDEVLEEMWDRFGMEPNDSQLQSDLTTWARAQSSAGGGKLFALQQYEQFTETLSSSDVCARKTFASDKHSEYDPSHPFLPTKALEDFPLGPKLLQTPTLQQYQPLAKHISIAISTRAYKSLHHSTKITLPSVAAKLQLNDRIRGHINADENLLMRRDFCLAFDPISFSPTATSLATVLSAGSSLDPSVFDRTTSIIATDVAPYVRGIVNFEARLQHLRLERSGLLSQGNGKPKKARMTRSAMSAIEGGARGNTRREKWFDVQLNNAWVFKTGGAWGGAVAEEEGKRRDVAIKALQHSQVLAQARMNALNSEPVTERVETVTPAGQAADD